MITKPMAGRRPFRIRKSHSSGKFYVLKRHTESAFGGDLISTGHLTIEAAMRSLKKYLGRKP